MAIAGGKGASLGEMASAGFPVPPGFVILSDAFEKFLEETDLNVEIDSILHSVNHREMHTVEDASEKIKALILNARMPKVIADEIQKFFKKLNSKFVAVRSSATSEDSASAAWAGQLDTYLNTTEKDLLENVKKCWASLFTPRAIFYRFEKELHKQKISVAVVVQKMIESEISGVAFSVHPVTQDKNQLIIEAGFGLGEAIVSGQITPDSYVVEKQPRRIIDKNVQAQSQGLYRAEKGGNEWRNIPKEKGEKQVLSDKEILELSEIILRIENHYGFPVDIEWAFEKGKFYIVQSRPITTLSNEGVKDIGGKPHDKKYPMVLLGIWNELPLHAWRWFNTVAIEHLQKLTGVKIKVFTYIKDELHYQCLLEEEVSQLRNKFEQEKTEKRQINYVKKISTSVYKKIPEIENYLAKIKNKKFEGFSNEEIVKTIKKLGDLWTEVTAQIWFMVLIDIWYPSSNEHMAVKKVAGKVRDYIGRLHQISDVSEIKLYEEVAKRLKMDYKDMDYLFPDEVIRALSKNTSYTREVKKRKQFCVTTSIEGNYKIYSGKKAKELFERYQPPSMGTDVKKELNGVSACKGRVTGIVCVIQHYRDFNNFKEGEILVALQTMVNYLPLMKKSKAILTEFGGLTSHAAIVSRELKKPCIVGISNLLASVRDGNKVEVDANKGIVRIIENDKKNNNQSRSNTTLQKTEEKKEKIERIFTKEHSREYSLFRVHTLSRIMREILPKMIGERAAEACSVYRGGDLVSVYYESEYLKRLFSKVAQKCQDIEYIKKEIGKFLKIFEKLKPYFIRERKPRDTEELKKILNLYAKLWAYIAMIWIVPTLPVDDKVKKLALKARETTQEYNEAMEPIIKEFLEKNYPNIKGKTRFVLPEEVWSGEVKNKDIKEKIAEREKGFVFYKGNLYSGNIDKTLNRLGITLEDKKSSISGEAEQKEGEIKGQIAFKGKVKGKVKIISSVKDLPKVEEGNILVAAMTMPKYLPAMKKASAFITDEGGITCHAAIVSREMQKPCIIGTKIATSVLKDGDLVEVDADRGVVRIIENNNQNRPITALANGIYTEKNYTEKSTDYVKLFELQGLPFLINSITLEHYRPLEAIAFQVNGIWKTYLPLRIEKKTLQYGINLFGSIKQFTYYKKEYNEYKRKSLKYFEGIVKKKNFSKDELKKYLQFISEEWKYYSKTEFFYVDDAYRKSSKNKIIAKNLKQLESIKNSGREHLNKLIFGDTCYLNRLLGLISKKFGIPTFDLLQYLSGELADLFDNKKVDKRILDDRRNAYAFIMRNGKAEVLQGREAEIFAKHFLVESACSELKGVVANPGRVSGKARVLVYEVKNFDKVSKMMKEMKNGEILIADTTSPEIMPACKKASAILTNQGGLLSHAAIVSRELGIPCIVGLGNVTHLVKDGDLVEVDANKGIVRIIENNKKNNNQSSSITTLLKNHVLETNANKHNILINKNYKFFYESRGYSFLLEDLIVKSYISWPVIIIGYKNRVRDYIPEKTIFSLRKKGGLLTEEEIKKSLITIQKKVAYLRRINTNTIDLNFSATFKIFNTFEEMLKAYSLFDISYSDGIYKKNQNDQRVKLIEVSKNVIRDDLDFVFFKKDGWLQTLLRRIAELFDIDMDEIRWYRESELFNLLENKKHLRKQIIDDRKIAYIFDRNEENDITLKQGRAAYKIIKAFENSPNTNGTNLKGLVANGKGMKITGEVCVIHRDYSNHQKLVGDMTNMKEGTILVTTTTDPEFLPALKKAKAVITDIGGLLSHAAISARELGIPCIIGTEQATKILKDGDLVEVDANNGVVKILANKQKEYDQVLHHDFPLIIPELTNYGEGMKNIPWSKNKFEFHPYCIFERKTDGILYYYYDLEGVNWKINEAGAFNKKIMEKKVLKGYSEIEDIIINKRALNRKSFLDFLEKLKKIWVWWDCMWWTIEYYDKHKLPLEDLIVIRKKTENLAPGICGTIRNSLVRIYPKYKKYIDVISMEEVKANKLPNKEVLEKRLKGYVYTNNRLYGSIEEVCKEFNIKIKDHLKDIDVKEIVELKGQTAYPGKVKGIVKHVEKRKDVLKFKKGEIIVSSTTTPDFLPAMKKSIAILSEHGGAICHASITARELKIPCIVGIKKVTHILKDGDLVEVDANKGIVRKIR